MVPSRRQTVLWIAASGAGCIPFQSPSAQSPPSTHHTSADRAHFVAEAERMRRQAVAAGDQSYGAVVVKGNAIIGWGPSRVVTDHNSSAHAERVAIWDAQAKLGSKALTGMVLYSTSLPCPACQAEAARAGIANMFWGPKATDAGAPRRS